MKVDRPEPVEVLDLFPSEREQLLRLLSELTDDEWNRPTVCPGWTVKDVALHLLGVNVGNLSLRRDGFRDPSTAWPENGDWEEVVATLADFNQRWVDAGRRVSPRLLCELIAFSGAALDEYFRGLDLSALGQPVSWAGPQPAPVWLDVAREYTEHWVHQQQIRDAVGRPALAGARYLAPVLATFVHALPQALRATDAASGTALRLVVTGEAGGRWVAVREGARWDLGRDRGGPAQATVTLDQDAAWRLFTRSLRQEEVARRVHLEGDRSLGVKVLEMVSIIA